MNMKGNVCYIAFAPKYGAGRGYSKKYDAYKFRPSLSVVIVWRCLLQVTNILLRHNTTTLMIIHEYFKE